MLEADNPMDAIIDRIYEASLLPDNWSEVLHRFAGIADSRAGIMIATSGDSFKWIGSSPEAERFTREHYGFEGARERTKRLIGLERAGFVSDFDVFTDREMKTIPLFSDYLIPMGLGRGIATVLKVPDNEMIVIHAEGDIRRGRFSQATIGRLDALRPHLARSALISARLAFEKARSAVDALSNLGLAACILRSDSKMIVNNLEFEAASARWKTRLGDKIVLADQRAQHLLSDTLMRISTNTGVRSIPLVATPEHGPAVLHILPIRRSAQDLFSQAAALLVLSTIEKIPGNPHALLQTLFDLTPREAEIAARICFGETLHQIASADGKSVLTVRGQVKSVLEKTNCRRQADLIRLVTHLSLG
ncbi:LuxR C-terminal-related transcriptional regulator [Rhizobium sp. Root483D2]|uniref:helix-turn-helix transcriptional regulator n=1 Tax=Rhizobium sp. Root483D2 TaxID=1736545 RepID=UPI000A6B7096|nr:LuxR C-terminal-related transcriptional regulator [Rhizobium sp. Root483D2]